MPASNDPKASSAPVFRDINLSAEIRKIWGKKWNAPQTEYEFSSGRKFERRPGDEGMYETSPDFGD